MSNREPSRFLPARRRRGDRALPTEVHRPPFNRERIAEMVRELNAARQTADHLLRELEHVGITVMVCAHKKEKWDNRNGRWLCADCAMPIDSIQCFACGGAGRFALGPTAPGIRNSVPGTSEDKPA